MTPREAASQRFRAEEERIRSAYRERHDTWRYSWLNPSHVYSRQEQHRAVLSVLRAAGHESLDGLRVLDIGCGTGHWLRQFVEWGATPQNLTGIDLLEDRVEAARRLCPAGVRLLLGNGAVVDEPDGRFDIALLITTLTSILDSDLRKAVAAEAIRVVKPQGLIVVYDFCVPSPGNADVRPLTKRDVRALFATYTIESRRITLAPPLTRLLAARARWMCDALTLVPFLRTHYLTVIRRDT